MGHAQDHDHVAQALKLESLDPLRVGQQDYHSFLTNVPSLACVLKYNPYIENYLLDQAHHREDNKW
tara:strand:- start:522 stop:719 length:198 start_codon:yes stop_codon:yes gene_type:complete